MKFHLYCIEVTDATISFLLSWFIIYSKFSGFYSFQTGFAPGNLAQVEVQKLAKRMDMVWGKAISQKNAASEEEIFHPNRGSVFAKVYEKLDEQKCRKRKIDHLNYEGNSTWKMNMMEFEESERIQDISGSFFLMGCFSRGNPSAVRISFIVISRLTSPGELGAYHFWSDELWCDRRPVVVDDWTLCGGVPRNHDGEGTRRIQKKSSK